MGSRNHRTNALAAAIAAVLAAVPASAAAEVDFLEARPGVSDAVLAGIRGGISTPDFFLTFAIFRTITANDTVLLEQRLAVSNLAEVLRTGVAPQLVTENLGVGVAVGPGNSLTSAIASAVGNPAAATQAAPQPAAPAPAVAAPQQTSPSPAPTAAAAQHAPSAPAVQAATPSAASAPRAAAAAQPAPSQSAPQQTSASPQQAIQQAVLTKPLVVNVPVGDGTVRAMVLQLPDGHALATAIQNSVSGINLRVSQTLNVNAKLLDAARSGQLQRDILNSMKLPH